jgi:hypothetical protein
VLSRRYQELFERQFGRFLIEVSLQLRNVDCRLGVDWHTCEDVLEGKLDVTGIECGSFNKGKVVLACSLLSASKHMQCPRNPECPILANCLASSVGTALRCLKSLLFPTSMMTIFESAWSRSSFNHRVTFSYVWCLLMS